MELLKQSDLSQKQFEKIDQLWNQEYPENLKDRFSLLLNDCKVYSHYLFENENNEVIAWAVDFEKDNEIRFSIIVDSKYKGLGYGKKLIEALKQEHTEFYGWVIDHNNDLKLDQTFYQTPMPFYLSLGFSILNDIRLETPIISAVKIVWKL